MNKTFITLILFLFSFSGLSAEIQFEDRESEVLEVNIYEIEGDTAKFIGRQSNIYKRGEIRKIK